MNADLHVLAMTLVTSTNLDDPPLPMTTLVRQRHLFDMGACVWAVAYTPFGGPSLSTWTSALFHDRQKLLIGADEPLAVYFV